MLDARRPITISGRRAVAAAVVVASSMGILLANPSELVSRHEPEVTCESAWGGSSAVVDHSMSDDGALVVFTSDAPDLVPGIVDDNGTTDVFLYQDGNGSIRLVSHAWNDPDRTANAASSEAVISADGSRIAFSSLATDLVPSQNDVNGGSDVFTCPFNSLANELASRTDALGGATAGNGPSRAPVLDAEGRRLAFRSSATDLRLLQSDGNGAEDLFVFEAGSGVRLLVSRAFASTNATGNGAPGSFQMSPDGLYVVFESLATNHVSGVSDTNMADDVFLWANGTMTMVSRAPGSVAAGGEDPRMSSDARKVVFETPMAYDGACDANGVADVYLWERIPNSYKFVSHPESGCPSPAGTPASRDPFIDPAGTVVVFHSDSSLGGFYGPPVLAVNHLSDDQVDSMTTAGIIVDGFFSNDGETFFSALGSVGRFCPVDYLYCGYGERARDMVAGNPREGVVESVESLDGAVEDNNGQVDLFMQRTSGAFDTVSRRDAGIPVPGSATAKSDLGQISDDGRFTVTTSDAGDLAEGQENVWGPMVHLNDLVLKTSTRLWTGGAPTQSHSPVISRDGRRVAYVAGYDVLLYDRLLDEYSILTRLANYFPDGASWEPGLDPSGTLVTFTTLATNLHPDGFITDANGTSDVHVYDVQEEKLFLVSRAAGAPRTAANGASYGAVMGGEAPNLRIVFHSEATNVVPGQIDGNGGADLFTTRHAPTEEPSATLITRSVAAPPNIVATGDRDCPLASPAIDDDGDTIVYSCDAKDLVGGLPFGFDTRCIFQYEVGTALNERVAGGNGDSTLPVLARDGRMAAFQSKAQQLVPSQSDGAATYDVFAVDLLTSETHLLSRRYNSACNPVCQTANAPSTEPSIDGDGRYVSFVSAATDLVNVPQQEVGVSDVFLATIPPQPLELVSHRYGSLSPGDKASSHALTGGFPLPNHAIVFSSDATNLTTDLDSNGHQDVFVHRLSPAPAAPGEVSNLRWNSRTALQWNPQAQSLAYRCYRGLAADLPALLTTGVDSCRRWQGGSTTIVTTGDVLSEVPAPGTFYWYLVDGVNFGGEGPPGSATSGPRILNSTGACP